MLENLSELSTLLVAVGLATERLVVVIKTVFPALGPADGARGAKADRSRRLLVLALAYVCALATSWLIAGGMTIQFASARPPMSIFVFAVLASGGSAFWTQVVGFASAAKDARQVQVTQLRQQAKSVPVRVSTPSVGAPTHVPELPVLPQ